jgi:hypothetical protein
MIMEATTERRRRTVTPFTKAWNQAKKLDDSEKLQLITLLAESVKSVIKREQSDACIDSAEREQARPEVKSAVAEPRKPLLYDPETGEYLNDETMQAIEDVRSGKDQGTTYESFEEFKKAMMAL